jgi:triosephosphate isomerase (TIM)
MKKIIIANWKMNLGNDRGIYLAEQLAALPKAMLGHLEAVICPPTIILRELRDILTPKFSLGAQDCAATEDGAYTGDISPLMLREAGCKYVILGHSERRHNHHETNATIKQKTALAIMHEFIPIVCVGETLHQFEVGETLSVLEQQITECLPDTDHEIIVAYEPVWAIGTGKVPTPQNIENVMTHLSMLLKDYKYKLIYGGSVAPNTIQPMLSIPSLDGFLVGGASLDIDKFSKLLEAVHS